MSEGLFLDVLPLLRDGLAVRELSEQLRLCVDQARALGKPASLSLKLTVTPDGTSGEYTLSEQIQTRLPQRTRETRLLGTPDGHLEPVPHQVDLDFPAAPEAPAFG
jgi:hypothetical protein